MKTLVKKFLEQDMSRREFSQALMAAGFTATAAQSLVTSVARAQDVPVDGAPYEFTGTGGEVLAECLKAAGVRFIFDVNSTGQGPFYDAVGQRPELDLIIALHEGQATAMAQGYELASGKTAILFVPSIGIPNALSNLYNAWKDRSAIAVLSDGSDNKFEGRDGFQQVDDWLEPTEQFTKWRWQVDNPDRIGELTRRVIKMAGTPPGAPVHLRIPGNLIREPNLTQTIYPQSMFDVPTNMMPNPDLIDETARMLIEAKAPLINTSSEVTRSGARDDLIELAEMLAIPVSQGFSVYGDFPFSHHLWRGYYGMGFPRGLRQTDVFLSLGALMPDMTIFTAPVPKGAKVVQASVDPDNIANTQPADLAVVGGMKEIIRSLIDSIKSQATEERIKTQRATRWDASVAEQKAELQKRMDKAQEGWNASPMQTERFCYEMDQVLDPTAILVGETGGRTPYEWIEMSKDGRMLIGQTTGYALGWGVGVAIGAKIAQPDRQVVAVVGDGAFLFGQIEALWTASRYDVPITIVVFNNQSYDGERNRIITTSSPLARAGMDMWKDMACYLGNPVVDYVGVAKAFDIEGGRIERPDEAKSVFERAAAVNAEGRPFMIDAMIARRGFGAESEWHPDVSIAEMRTRKI